MICYSCGDSKNLGYNWYKNYDRRNNTLCGLCYRRLILNPKWNPINNKKWNPIVNKRTQRFKNRIVYVGYNPRHGICCWCFRMGVFTNMAHLKGYHDDDPLFGTYELCIRCHRRFDKGTLKPAKTRKELEALLSKTVRPQYYNG